MREIDEGTLSLVRGTLTLVPVTNPLAYARGTRVGDRNLNRRLQPTTTPREFEDEIANWLCPLLRAHDALLDLHSFHTGGEPFVMVGPENNTGTLEPFSRAAEEEAFARVLGVRRFVDGWLDTYARGVARRRGAGLPGMDCDEAYGIGTTEYMRAGGGLALTLECGQHHAPQAPLVAYGAVINTLLHFGLIEGAPPAAVDNRQSLRLYEVIDRHDAGDTFAREWSSFDVLEAGTLIAKRASGEPLIAGEPGFIVFPNPNASPGHEWFYLARELGRV
jgi:predicted deacylase